MGGAVKKKIDRDFHGTRLGVPGMKRIALSTIATILVLTVSCERAPEEREPSAVERSGSPMLSAGDVETDVRLPIIPHDTPPSIVEYVQPEYPQDARNAGIEGVVLLHLFVDEQGKVTIAHVVKSVEPSLDEAALEAARRTSFRPALKGDEPVGVWVAYPAEFRLKPKGQ